MSPSNKRALDSEIPTTPRKRTRRIDSSPVDVSPRKKGKKGKDKEDVDPFAHSRQVLAEFEDELSCAMYVYCPSYPKSVLSKLVEQML